MTSSGGVTPRYVSDMGVLISPSAEMNLFLEIGNLISLGSDRTEPMFKTKIETGDSKK